MSQVNVEQIQNAVNIAVTKAVQPIAAELIELKSTVKAMKDAALTGQGSTGANAFKFSDDELREALPFKLASTGLDEIVSAEAAKAGISVEQYLRQGKKAQTA